MKILLSFLAAGFLSSASFCQSTISVEAPVANYYSQSHPVGGSQYFNFSKGCFLISASELPALLSSSITAFGFSLEHGTLGSSVNGNVTIYLQNTTDNSYLKSTTYATAIAGMTQIYSGNMTIPSSINPTQILFNLPANFNYTGGGIYVAYSWTSTSTPSSSDAWYYTNQVNVNMAAYATSIFSAPQTSIMALSHRRPVCVFEALNTATNEAGVLSINSPGQIAESWHATYSVTADIQNNSINPLTGVNVSLNITGDNPFSDTQIIPSIAPGAIETVTFSAFYPSVLGINNIVITLPSDQNNANNSIFTEQHVNCYKFSNSPPAATYTTSFGNANAGVMALSKFNFSSTNTLTAVNLAIGTDYTPNAYIYGVVLDNSGLVIATTNTINAPTGAMNNIQTFSFVTEQELTANLDYYIGMAETKGYYMAANEHNVGPGLYYSAAITGGNLQQFTEGYFGIEPIIAGPKIIVSQASTVICNGESILLSANGASSYTWSSSIFNPIDNPNGVSILVKPTSNEMYEVIGADDAGCINTTTAPVAVKPCTGLTEMGTLENIELYPNPSVNGKAFVKGLEGVNKITLFNVLGETVQTHQSSESIVELDLSNQPSGTYLVRIEHGDKSYKIVKLIN